MATITMGMSIIPINAEIQASCKVCYLFQRIADIKSSLLDEAYS